MDTLNNLSGEDVIGLISSNLSLISSEEDLKAAIDTINSKMGIEILPGTQIVFQEQTVESISDCRYFALLCLLFDTNLALKSFIGNIRDEVFMYNLANIPSFLQLINSLPEDVNLQRAKPGDLIIYRIEYMEGKFIDQHYAIAVTDDQDPLLISKLGGMGYIAKHKLSNIYISANYCNSQVPSIRIISRETIRRHFNK